MRWSALPLPLIRLWYDLLFNLRLRIGVRVFAVLFSHSPRWLSVRLPLLLALSLGLTQGLNIQAAIKLMMAGAVYAVIVSVLRCLAGRRSALLVGAALLGLMLTVGVFRPVGRYEEMVPPARFVDEPQSFRTTIHTFPDSPRWAKIKAAGASPYLFVSSPTLFEGDMAVVIFNGVGLGPLQAMPGAQYGSGSWAAPLPWSMIEGHADVEIELQLKPGPKGGFWFAAAAATPISGRKPVQQFRIGNGPWQEVSSSARPLMMTIELRFADDLRRNIGILY